MPGKSWKLDTQAGRKLNIMQTHVRPLKFLSLLLLAISFQLTYSISDWPDWRGPARDGISQEKDLPTHWSPAGENLLWKARYGSRSAPVVLGDRLYLQNSVGKGDSLQERVMCFDANSGKVLWEHHFNVYLSDVPPHRVGWAAPVIDPATGNVYAYGVGGTLLSLSPNGKLLWERSLAEDFGLVTTHGGRTVSPIIEGDLVIVSGINSGWGEQARAAHRFMAFDKKIGETIWVSSPGGRPFDTTYSPPIAAEINGMRLIIAGGGDGTVHALKAQSGEPVWKYVISKRGVNTGVVVKGATAIVSHSEENLDTSDMGLIAAIDASARGEIGKDQVKWRVNGFQGGYSSPVIDGDRVYQVDNGSNLYAFDAGSGKELWKQNLGTVQKSSPVLADGKLYVGTESGKFYILKPGPERCEILDHDLLGTEANPEPVIASVAVSNGRVYLASMETLYCIGEKSGGAARGRRTQAPSTRSSNQQMPASETQSGAGSAAGVPAFVQVSPTELVLKPGESVQLRARLFDSLGHVLNSPAGGVVWSLDQLRGTIKDGLFTAASDARPQAGQVKATVGTLSGSARLRVISPLPWSENFDGISDNVVPRQWINATGKFALRDMEGSKVLVKLADNPFTKRGRVFMGPSTWSGYTAEIDVRAAERRRQMGDAGVNAQRYSLILFGNHQRLELESWQPETARTVRVPFPWKADTWYRLKLQVENLPDGKVRARGKAWPAAEKEPAEWLVEKVDPQGNRQGSPGIYADAPFEIFFDNLKVTPNR
jgi:outer membrane protein assembly factor BamB